MSKLLKVFLIASFAVASFSAKAVTVASWGGAYTESQQKAYADTYSDPSSIQFENYNGGLGEVRAQVESGSVTWDLVDVLPADAITGCDEGLFEDISADIATNAVPGPNGESMLEDMENNGLEYHSGWDCCVPQIFWTYVVFYDPDAFPGEKPATMADFFDTNAHPGKRGMRKNPKVTLEFALIADGVPTDQVYDVLSTEEGVARAFAKLDTIKDDVVWWEAGAQPPQLLADGEVVFTTAWNGRVFNAKNGEGQPFEMVWDGQIYDLDLWVIPKGSKNKEAALDFVAFSTATEQLAAQASWISYGPARKSSEGMVGSYHSDPSLKMAPHMPTASANFANALQNDFEFWADNQDQLNERFNAWLAQ